MGRKIDVLDAAWAAGIVDGEGYIIISRAKNKYRNNTSYFTLVLAVEMQDKGAIEKLHGLFGGSVTLRPKSETRKAKRDAWIWRCGGPTAQTALETILPYLVVKDEQANLALEFQRGKLNCTHLAHKGVIGRNPVPDDEQQLRESYYNRMKVLNATYQDGVQ